MFHIPNSQIYFGPKTDLNQINNTEKWCVVHFCKSYFDHLPSGRKVRSNPKLKTYHEELYVDILDGADSNDFDLQTFNQTLNWIHLHSKGKNIFIHCDWGQSRSPVLAMLYAAKCASVIPDNFFQAIEIIKNIQPEFVLPSGISKFAKANWSNFSCH